MTNRDAKREKTMALAERLWGIRDLILHDSWNEAATAWQDYQTVAATFDSELR